MYKYIIEFIGTFFLVLTVGLTAGFTDFAPIAIGVSLAVMVYMGGNISGAHYNPAVTLAILMRGKIDMGNALAYMASQIAGAVVAGAVAMFLKGDAFGAPAVGANVSVAQALVNELLFTFALASVVLNVATTKKAEGNSYYGWAIGCTVLFAAFAGGGISGGAYNPAVGLGPNLIKGALGDVWIYLVGPFAGAALAAVIFKITNPDEK